MSSKIYPIGIQNFEKIRKDGYFYIDKTALIYQLVKTGSCGRRVLEIDGRIKVSIRL